MTLFRRAIVSSTPNAAMIDIKVPDDLIGNDSKLQEWVWNSLQHPESSCDSWVYISCNQNVPASLSLRVDWGDVYYSSL